jgi:predicted Zn-ribbon and HTH transcriptional regulator
MAEKIEDEAKTVRQRIAEYLENMSDAHSIADISRIAGSDRSENVIDDINHTLKSLKMKGITFRIMPATCKKCNFIFKQTKHEVKEPSKCPKCKGELINPPIIQRK